MCSCRWSLRWFLAIALVLLSGRAAGSDPPAEDVKALRRRAAGLEKTGNYRKAAETYESIMTARPAYRRVLAPRVARLYARSGNVSKAVAWADEVMAHSPDPQAYLAGILALAGNTERATRILRKELRKAKGPRRRVALHWQLADVYRQQGDMSAVERHLREAVKLAEGRPESKAAGNRLRRFIESRSQTATTNNLSIGGQNEDAQER